MVEKRKINPVDETLLIENYSYLFKNHLMSETKNSSRIKSIVLGSDENSLYSVIGNFGKFQLIWYLFLSWIAVISGYNTLVQIFSQYYPDFSCYDYPNSTCQSNGQKCSNFTFDENSLYSIVIDFSLVCDDYYLYLMSSYALWVPAKVPTSLGMYQIWAKTK